jgi:hypothetical protein
MDARMLTTCDREGHGARETSRSSRRRGVTVAVTVVRYRGCMNEPGNPRYRMLPPMQDGERRAWMGYPPAGCPNGSSTSQVLLNYVREQIHGWLWWVFGTRPLNTAALDCYYATPTRTV